MTNPTQIPASVIPELVKYLMGDGGCNMRYAFRRWYHVTITDIYSDCVKEHAQVQSALTAAFLAFNEREPSDT